MSGEINKKKPPPPQWGERAGVRGIRKSKVGNQNSERDLFASTSDFRLLTSGFWKPAHPNPLPHFVGARESMVRTLRRAIAFAKGHSRISITAGALVALIAAAVIADLALPPDMTRYEQVSPEVVARDGSLLRPYLSKDG